MIDLKEEHDVQIWCDYQEETKQTSANFFLRLRFYNFRTFPANVINHNTNVNYGHTGSGYGYARSGYGWGNGCGFGCGYGFGYGDEWGAGGGHSGGYGYVHSWIDELDELWLW